MELGEEKIQITRTDANSILPGDNFLVMMEEFEDWDEVEIVGEGAESGELKSISPLFGSSEGKRRERVT